MGNLTGHLPSLSDTFGERRAFDQLQHERPEPVGIFQTVDSPNMRVIQEAGTSASR
jgi:hypothetical protein